MTAENSNLESYLLKYTFLVTPYATLISLLYLWGFWSLFKINVFTYIALTDILKLALIPVLYVTFISGFMALTMFFMDSLKAKQAEKRNVVLQPISPRASNAINAVLAILFSAVLVMNNPSKWAWFASLGSVLFARILQELQISKRFLSNDNLRYAISLLVVTPLFGSFGLGRKHAQAIFIGDDKSRIVDTKLFREYGSEVFTKKQLFNGQEQLKFIGTANDYIFFISMDNSKVYIARFSDVHFLEFNY
jgi:hypothetical protein